ncbi:putative magnesium transporter NIPA9 [Primulina tabacum]|uniref:putative magnesium transporter NIPA9 n=1 Tax=Primulina tabacum TaxID=48773 RepID=UPI003F5958A7
MDFLIYFQCKYFDYMFLALYPSGSHYSSSPCFSFYWHNVNSIVISTYVSNKPWVVGFLMDILGAFLMLLALSQAPEMMNAIDWIGITLACIGTIGNVLLNGWLRVYRRQRREQELMQYEVIEEIIYGLESGSLFGIASVVSKMGFVFVEQEFSKLMLPICISIGIFCSASGFAFPSV